MKLFNTLLSRSHSGYTRLTKSVSWLHSSKSRWFCHMVGHYFCQTTTFAPFLLLPVTLLYITCKEFSTVLLIPFIVIFVLGILYQAQDLLLYHPSMPETSRINVPSPPEAFPYEEVHLHTADNVNLHGFFLKQSDEKFTSSPTLVYFHGNAGNAGLPSIIPLYMTCQVNILMVDYRGYGRSSGRPSESGLYIDGETAVQYLHQRQDIDSSKIVLFGHSLGGAVAIHLASESQWVKGRVAAVVVENTFTNIPDTADHIFKSIFPFMNLLPHFCYKNRFDSISKVKNIHVPMLFIFGDKDEIVSPTMSRTLYESAHNPRSAIVQVPGGSHNDTWCVSPIYQMAVSSFLQKVFANPLSIKDWQSPKSSEEQISVSWEWQQDIANSHSTN